jgi:hydrogenase-4 component E
MTTVSNLLAFVGLVLGLLLVWRQSWPGRLALFVAQSAVLALLAAAIGLFTGRRELLIVAVIFAVIKGRVIPRVLGRISRGAPVRPVPPGRSAGLSLLVAAGLVVVAYVIMLPVTTSSTLPTTDAIPLAFASALIGLFVCVTGRDAFGHILGFLVFENGIFALALLATYGLPALVEAGVFLDVLVIVLIMEGVAGRLRHEHASIEVDRLRELRG